MRPNACERGGSSVGAPLGPADHPHQAHDKRKAPFTSYHARTVISDAVQVSASVVGRKRNEQGMAIAADSADGPVTTGNTQQFSSFRH